MQRYPVSHQPNLHVRRDAPYGRRQAAVLSREQHLASKAEISSWPGYRPTPLSPLPGLAASLSVSAIFYKDEGFRFDLQSFKALGGAYAVIHLLKEHLRERDGTVATSDDLRNGCYRALTSRLTVAAATDGNHGRSVAWGAQMFGCSCVIYLHEKVSQTREAQIARHGARIVRVPGGYDNSVHQCALDAKANGWELVADTSANSGAKAPSLVMQGYTLLVEEIMQQTEHNPPTHIFVPGAVGGLAAAVVGHLWETMGSARPRIIIVQPANANCISRSIAAGMPTQVPGEVDTFMACLAAAEVSPAAWEILERGLDDVITIPDDAARDAMGLLALGVGGDRPIVSGESGCASTAGLIAASQEPKVANSLGLGPSSRVVVVGSEGAADTEVYTRTVGRTPEQVSAAAVAWAQRCKERETAA